MASGKDNTNKNGFPDIDHRFRDMREQMNRDREAFFNDGSGNSSGTPIFGRESPFFRVSPKSLVLQKTPTLMNRTLAKMISLLHLRSSVWVAKI